ncbi:hypothetical protein [Leifsonia sp. ZF2019]|uniref:hypothetical protein n=1 Tax=Leifsonia sp. ZF2019 TaxID=2781978 RepID=UPI001CC048FF|nr:hypothetical protein [Leifsonia sp. ZF2019]
MTPSTAAISQARLASEFNSMPGPQAEPLRRSSIQNANAKSALASVLGPAYPWITSKATFANPTLLTGIANLFLGTVKAAAGFMVLQAGVPATFFGVTLPEGLAADVGGAALMAQGGLKMIKGIRQIIRGSSSVTVNATPYEFGVGIVEGMTPFKGDWIDWIGGIA